MAARILIVDDEDKLRALWRSTPATQAMRLPNVPTDTPQWPAAGRAALIW